MAKLRDFYLFGVEMDPERIAGQRKGVRDGFDTVVTDRNRWPIDSEVLDSGTEKLQRAIEGLARKIDADRALMRAQIDTELAGVRAELVRSENEKQELQDELDDTKRENGELNLENAMLRSRLNAPPRGLIN